MTSELHSWSRQVERAAHLYHDNGGSKVAIIFKASDGELRVGTKKEMERQGGKEISLSQIISQSLSIMVNTTEIERESYLRLTNNVRLIEGDVLSRTSKVTRLFHKSLLLSQKHQFNAFVDGIEKICQMKSDDTYEQLEKLAQFFISEHVSNATKLSPTQFEILADRLLLAYRKIGKEEEGITTVQQLYEKGAEEYEKLGNFKEAFALRSRFASQIVHSLSHPLYPITQLTDSASSKDLGFHASSQDTGVIKRGQLHIAQRNIEGKKKLSIDFELTRPVRKKIEPTLQALLSHPDLIEEKGVTVKVVPNFYMGAEIDPQSKEKVYSHNERSGVAMGQAYEIRFPNRGVIHIGADADIRTLYPTVTVELTASDVPGENLSQLTEMLSLIGLGSITCPSRKSDKLRMKIAHLFHQFFPQDAVKMEQNGAFYETSIDELKLQILERQPKMASIFSQYLDHPENMKEIEISPGRQVYYLEGLGMQMMQAGALGLMHGQRSLDDLPSTLKFGSLSSYRQYSAALFGAGVSPSEDHRAGSAKCVFTRIFASSFDREDLTNEFIPFSGDVQYLFDTNVAGLLGRYAYVHDQWGSKNPKLYNSRSDIITHCKKLSSIKPYALDNELMLLDQIPPTMIKGICVEEKNKEKAITAIREAGLIRLLDGVEYVVLNDGVREVIIPLERFVMTGNRLTTEMWRFPSPYWKQVLR